MKNCKRRTIFSWIFALVLLVPMFSIAVRCLYVVINKNAYQSYSDTINITYVNVNTQQSIEGQEYQVRYNPNGTNTGYQYLKVLDNRQNILTTFFTPDSPYYSKVIDRFTIEKSGTYLYLYFNDSTYTAVANWYNISYNFNFVSRGTETFTTTDRYYTIWSINRLNGTIDNVFEYSISQFVDKHGNGLINFFALLQDYFMQSTTANALYFTFANWCLNYVLLVSCVWLLFSVLMWFINYCNYMLNTSFRKGHGE